MEKEKYCTNCNGYGSLLKEESEVCSRCGGTGIEPDDPIYQQAIDDIQHLKDNNLEG